MVVVVVVVVGVSGGQLIKGWQNNDGLGTADGRRVEACSFGIQTGLFLLRRMCKGAVGKRTIR